MSLLEDLRFGLRILTRNPGFAVLAIVTIALGIGVNSTVFTLVNGVFFRGLPFDDPSEIVRIELTSPEGFGSRSFLYEDYVALREHAHSFRDLAGFVELASDLSDPDHPAERVEGARITANMFPLLGQEPVLGRSLLPDDAAVGAEPVVLISYGLWQARYGGDPAILDRTLRMDLEIHTIVGVMPEGEGFPDGTDLWVAFDPNRGVEPGARIQVFGRLDDGVSVGTANVELAALSPSLQTEIGRPGAEFTARVEPFTDLGGEIVAVFAALQGAVTFVLLIACANVANLLLSRAVGRTRETSIRTAVGAGRWRIVRLQLTESLTMGILGGALGLLLAVVGVRAFWNAVADTGPPYWLAFPIDPVVLAYFVVISVVSSLLFGLMPALQISRTDVNAFLKDGGRGTSGGLRARRLTGALLIGEVTLTLVLLVGAGLMVRSFLNTQRVDLGFDPQGLVSANLSPRPTSYPEPEDRVRLTERLLERLAAQPGVEAVTAASHAPGGGAWARPQLMLEGEAPRPAPEPGQFIPPQAWSVHVTPGYFEAMDLDVRGRPFLPGDGLDGREVGIVNQVFVERLMDGQDPIGRRVRLSSEGDAPWLEIVGVSPNVLQSSTDTDTSVQPTVYVPYRMDPDRGTNIIVRSRVAPETIAAAMREQLRLLDPDLPLYNIRTVSQMLSDRTWPYRVFGTLFAIFAFIALVMSSVGIYGVTSYAVGQRFQEIGIRMALGARRRDIMWMIVRQGLIRVGVGIALGIPLALALSRVLESVLVNVTATDLATFIILPAVLAVVTLTACVVPACQALALDPADALRVE